MPLVRYQVAVSIDGFVAPEDGSSDWLNPYGRVAMDFIGPWVKKIGGIIVGRATYDQATGLGGWMRKDTPVLALTSRPLPKKLPSSIAASNDPPEGLKSLRARMQAGDIWLFGGGTTAGAFLERNLIDLLELAVVPVALGKGRTLFGGVAAPTTFEQAGSEALGSGCVVNTYRRIDADRATTPLQRRAQSRS